MRGRYDEGPAEEDGAETAHVPRVLVVDDEAVNVRLVQAYLAADGFDTVAASDGERALEIIAKGGVDLVLLDIRMPRMDGYVVCQRIRDDPKNARLPVVFLTAEPADPESELHGLEAGADEYLHKPIQRRMLVARVRALLRLADAERDRKLLAQLAQAEKLAAIGQIAAGVAHEINNPLAFILSNIGSLKGYLADVSQVIAAYRLGAEEGQRMEERIGFRDSLADIDSLLQETAAGGQRVRAIVQGLKTFSRADDDLSLEPVDLKEIASATLLLTERELSSRARVVKELEPALVARAPRGKLHQVVLNLLVNAMQSLDAQAAEGQEIRVFTRCAGGQAVLGVSDTGCGIPADAQARIFDPFFTTKPVGIGTGIGLSVCRVVVEKLGGSIRVDSEVGRGSTFTISMPQ